MHYYEDEDEDGDTLAAWRSDFDESGRDPKCQPTCATCVYFDAAADQCEHGGNLRGVRLRASVQFTRKPTVTPTGGCNYHIKKS